MGLRIIPLNNVKWKNGIATLNGKKFTGVLQEFSNDRIISIICKKGAIDESVINTRNGLVKKIYSQNDAGNKFVKIVKNGKENIINITQKQQEGLDISSGFITPEIRESIVDELVAKGYKGDNSFWYHGAEKYYDEIGRPEKAFNAAMKGMEIYTEDFKKQVEKSAKISRATAEDSYDFFFGSYIIGIKHYVQRMFDYLHGRSYLGLPYGNKIDAKKTDEYAQKLYDFLAKIETNDEAWNKHLLPYYKRTLNIK